MSDPSAVQHVSFLNENAAILLSFVSFTGTCIAGFLVFLLKSRIRECHCGCIRCYRDVIPPEKLNDVTLMPLVEPPPSQAPLPQTMSQPGGAATGTFTQQSSLDV